MSTHELYEMLTEMVRQGPGHVVAFALGVGAVALVLTSVHWVSRRPLLRRIEELASDNNRLVAANAAKDADLQITHAENDRLRAEVVALGSEAESLRQSKTQLATALACVKEDAERLRAAAEAASEENRRLSETKGKLEGQLSAAREEALGLRAAHDAIQSEARLLREDRARLEMELDGLRKERERLLTIQVDVASELVARKESEAALLQQVAELTEQTQRLAGFDGKIWEKVSVGPVPAFCPIPQRGLRIIALANLKGGVGKTTLAANLGALLAENHRVLLIDLDYQGSLTSLCLPPDAIEEIRRRGEFVDRLFQAPELDIDAFGRCCHAAPEQPRLRVIAADENLADVENRAMAEWLLRPERRDVRHVLRSYLHAPAVAQQFDFVLLDCPPRLTTACINAFSAADFVLIPVIPDQTSAEAVPRQLRALKNLQAVLCPRLEVLGLVANRTHPKERLIQREQAIWDALPRLCEDTWGREVHQFRTVIRQKGAFAEAARANRFAVFYQDVEPMFRDLARELRERMAAHERQPAPVVSLQPQPAA